MKNESRILLVDDEKNTRLVVTVRLKASGYDVLAVDDAETALKQIAKYNPDIIISDTLSRAAKDRINGYSLCKKLKFDDMYKNIPFMFLSAEAQKPKIEQGYAAGADLYMTKPYDSEELLKNIEMLLNRN